jgi:hypothetical protein
MTYFTMKIRKCGELKSAKTANKIVLKDTNGAGRGDYAAVAEEKRIEGEKRVRNEGWRLKELQKEKEVRLLF